MRNASFGIFAALLVGASGAARAQDADHGMRLAERWCASCHAVAQAKSGASDAAPSFKAIAGRGSFTAETLAFFLLAPHPAMPSLSLSRSEARDLAAYVATRKK